MILKFIKKKHLIFFIIISIIFTSLLGCTQNVSNTGPASTPLTMEEKLEDFEYLYKIMEENYPFLKVNERLNGVNWLKEKEKYISMIEKSTTDNTFNTQIKRILKELNNGHTHVLGKDNFPWYYSVYSGSKFNKPWVEVLSNKKTLKWYNFDKKELLHLKDQGYFGSKTSVFTSIILKPKEIAYVKINQMNSSVVEADGKELRKFYEEIKDYDKLIIDIRGNSGGDDLYWRKNVIEPLAREPITVENYIFTRGDYGKPFYKARGIKQSPISKLNKDILNGFHQDIEEDFDNYFISRLTLSPVDSIRFEGNIYLLVDKGVYSSSESFSVFCKDSGFATLVGEATGGDGIGIDPLLFSLPNSGIVVRFSSLLALNGDGSINEEVQTRPDVIIQPEVIVKDPKAADDLILDDLIQYVIND